MEPEAETVDRGAFFRVAKEYAKVLVTKIESLGTEEEWVERDEDTGRIIIRMPGWSIWVKMLGQMRVLNPDEDCFKTMTDDLDALITEAQREGILIKDMASHG